jgi:hypothetical protein
MDWEQSSSEKKEGVLEDKIYSYGSLLPWIMTEKWQKKRRVREVAAGIK